VSAQAQQAGPGADHGVVSPLGLEAAGPAGPRLLIEEVSVRIGPGGRECRVALRGGPLQFVGTASSEGTGKGDWGLVAAASVGALQQYLQQCTSCSPTPRIELLDTALTTTGLGTEVIHATVRLAHGSESIELLGSALVRNDRRSTAAAATLDAVARRLQRYHLPEAVAPPQHAVSPVQEEPPRPVRTGPAPPRATRLDSTPRIALGVHLGDAVICVTAVDESAKLVAQTSRPGPVGASAGRLGEMVEVALAAAQEVVRGIGASGSGPAVVGLALPASLINGMLGHTPLGPEADAGARFREQLGLPVAMMTTQQATAIAEHRVGAAQGAASLLLAEVADELQVALVNGGESRHLFDAGHLVINGGGPRCQCGQRGCWQALAGHDALVSRAFSAANRGGLGPLVDLAARGPQAVTAETVCRLAAGGDGMARDVVQQTGRYLALGLANLIAVLAPEVVMIAGSPARVADSLRHAAEAEIKLSPRATALSRCVFLSPQLGEVAPAVGAALQASSVTP